SDQGTATVIEKWANNDVSAIDLIELQKDEGPSHTSSAILSQTSQPKSAVWKFYEKGEKGGVLQWSHAEISLTQDRNQIRFIHRRDTSRNPYLSDDVFLRAAVLEKTL
ncbi:MAG: hypothetical protein ABIQ95_05685, partial [Bdellovibrionia bacterium]